MNRKRVYADPPLNASEDWISSIDPDYHDLVAYYTIHPRMFIAMLRCLERVQGFDDHFRHIGNYSIELGGVKRLLRCGSCRDNWIERVRSAGIISRMNTNDLCEHCRSLISNVVNSIEKRIHLLIASNTQKTDLRAYGKCQFCHQADFFYQYHIEVKLEKEYVFIDVEAPTVVCRDCIDRFSTATLRSTYSYHTLPGGSNVKLL